MHHSDALHLEAYKLLQDRTYSLSTIVSLVLLNRIDSGSMAPPNNLKLRTLIRQALRTAHGILGLEDSLGELPSDKKEKRIEAFLEKDWNRFSTLGLAYPSHRRWDGYPPASEILDRYKILRFTGGVTSSFGVMFTQLVRRPHESFGNQKPCGRVARLVRKFVGRLSSG